MNNDTTLFIITTVMELATLACAYLGLRLFKKNKWLRLNIIIVPMLINALCYVIFRATPFFYMGVVLLLCLPFVWPRKSQS